MWVDCTMLLIDLALRIPLFILIPVEGLVYVFICLILVRRVDYGL